MTAIRSWLPLAAAGIVALAMLTPLSAIAHDVAQGDKAFVQATQGPAFIPFLYLGAKHMVTGYDHILFLVGVVLLLRRLRDVVIYVSMFTIGHSSTLLLGVLSGYGLNGHIVDAIIGLSIVYKGADNLKWPARFGVALDARVAILLFGLFHGMGLASKLLDLSLSRQGLVTNLAGFNIGVELGQILVLLPIVLLLDLWRDRPSFQRGAIFASYALVACGLLITIDQTMRYLQS